MLNLTLLIGSFLLSWRLVVLIKSRWGKHLLDVPNERSAHIRPTASGGGLGFIVAAAFTSGVAIALESDLSDPLLCLAWGVLLPLAIIGLVDDLRGVSARIRYLVQLGTSLAVIACFGSFPQPWLLPLGFWGALLGVVLTAIAMSALINFYNFMDGSDGLVAGVSAVQLAFLAFWLPLPSLGLLVAALLGFLVWNWPPAKVFMGDAGSTVLGAMVAIALLRDADPARAWSALAVTLPLVGDAAYTLTRRLSRGENIFQAHRSHLYQRLQQAGWSHAQVAIAYMLATLLLAVSIEMLGSTGAWLSLTATGVAIALGERYLRSRPAE